jgi:iron complex transport system substrate-binding protein
MAASLEAGIAAELIRAAVVVHVFNQRDSAGMLAMIRTLGPLFGAPRQIKPPLILQPRPAALTEGVDAMKAAIAIT